ncbi:hypothetical protein, partial [Massilia sp. YIM B04103]|uniref:hypothetical protein n=1 Tax=Massilia sp. YIM B04103 TaxID=2963106 RepID=UPI0021097013
MAADVVDVGAHLRRELGLLDGSGPIVIGPFDHAGARHAAHGIVFALIDHPAVALDGREAAGAIVL